MQSSTPECTHSGLASSAFARRYLRNRCFFLFLRLLRCFSSPGSLPCVMDWRMDDRSLSCRVSPFRHPRIIGYLLLPAAFRSLSRLSSALSAKASALCPSLFDLFVFFRHIALWRGPYSLILTVSRDSLFLMSFLLSDNRCFLYSMQFSRYILTVLSPSGCLTATAQENLSFSVLLRPDILSHFIRYVRPAKPRLRFTRLHQVSRTASKWIQSSSATRLHLISFSLAATCSPTPSPVQYHRPLWS